VNGNKYEAYAQLLHTMYIRNIHICYHSLPLNKTQSLTAKCYQYTKKFYQHICHHGCAG